MARDMNNMYQNMIRSVFKKEERDKYSHLIIIVDNDMEYIKRKVLRSENIKDVIYGYVSQPYYLIKEIYNYDMDLDSQLTEKKAYNINLKLNDYERVYEFAKKKHENQRRRGGNLYIEHPVMVSMLVGEYFKDSQQIDDYKAIALLHDTLEDTDTTYEELKDNFGLFISKTVKELTNDREQIKKMGKTNYLCLKLCNMSTVALNIKLCDRLANIIDLKNADLEFQDKYLIETIVIMHYLLYNRKPNYIQKDIIKEINSRINELQNNKILIK